MNSTRRSVRYTPHGRRHIKTRRVYHRHKRTHGEPATNTQEDVKAIMMLKGHVHDATGVFGIRLCNDVKGTIGENVTIEPDLYMDLYNLRAVRGNVRSDLIFDSTMSGPHDYFGTVDPTKAYRILGDEDKLRYYEYNTNGRELPKRELRPLPESLKTTLTDYEWINGKDVSEELKTKYNVKTEEYVPINPDGSPVTEKDLAALSADSLFADPGMLEISGGLNLPLIENPWIYDLSKFNAQVVPNNEPFAFNQVLVASTHRARYPLRVITYNYAERYVSDYVMNGNGIFIERHDFIQAITPINRKCGGFIMLGYEEEGKLTLIAAKVPFGYTLIVDSQSIHGDSTMTGKYMMSMTGSLEAMSTADTVFIKDKTKSTAACIMTTPSLDPTPICPASRFILSTEAKSIGSIKKNVNKSKIIEVPVAFKPPFALNSKNFQQLYVAKTGSA